MRSHNNRAAVSQRCQRIFVSPVSVEHWRAAIARSSLEISSLFRKEIKCTRARTASLRPNIKADMLTLKLDPTINSGRRRDSLYAYADFDESVD
jgi:hypothetical protein